MFGRLFPFQYLRQVQIRKNNCFLEVITNGNEMFFVGLYFNFLLDFLQSVSCREFTLRLVYGRMGNKRIPLPAYSSRRKQFPIRMRTLLDLICMKTSIDKVILTLQLPRF